MEDDDNDSDGNDDDDSDANDDDDEFRFEVGEPLLLVPFDMPTGVLGGAGGSDEASRRIFDERPKTTASGLSSGISGYDEMLEDDSRRIFVDVRKVASLSLSREISEEFGD